jgi:hypothetical protein
MSIDGLAVSRQHLRLKEDDVVWSLARHDLNGDLIPLMALAKCRLLLPANILQSPHLDDRSVGRSIGIELCNDPASTRIDRST